ncbi:MAG: hemC [Nitrospirae bacterium]|nr:hemC [Nitrospirota bacterium]
MPQSGGFTVSTEKRVKSNRITIGTRGSKLALWQAEYVKTQLQKLYPDLTVEILKIKTTGDKILDVPLAQVGGKGLFVKEIEEALLRHEADIAVHSMKDVPTDFPDGLHLAVVCEREDPRDALISQTQKSKIKIQNFRDLPNGARVGTSSLRRSCQLLSLRPDLKIEQLRGNLDTRLRKLDEGQFDAIILATAGVKRLGLQDRITEILSPDISLPAIGQGAVGIECRINDEFVNDLISPLNHAETFVCVKAERAFLKKLEGGCQVPIAAHARLTDGRIVLDGLVGSISGDKIIKGHSEGEPGNAENLGIALAEEILSRGAKEILDEVYKSGAPLVNGEISS